MMLYESTKAKVRSPDADKDFFDITTGILQGDTLETYLVIVCRDYVSRPFIDLINENGFSWTKARNRRYPMKTMTGADYNNDLDYTCPS